MANQEISSNLGIAALKFYANTYDFMDNYPLATAYYHLSRIYFSHPDLTRSSEYLAKSLKLNPNFQLSLAFQTHPQL